MHYSSLNAQQITTSGGAKFLIEAGGEFGGDEILTVYFEDGDDQKMHAGQGGYVAVGGEFHFRNLRAFMMRGTVGYKYVTTAADNANIKLTRIPINLLGYYRINDDFRLGAGLTTHQLIRFKGDGFVPDADLSSSLGGRFEFGWRWVALTYTAINYKNEFDYSFSANSIGLAISFTFPQD
ncbi:MAG: hypothetical protein CMF36_07115 [Leeuwenhoekiella sp.]|nr:hypothetical protein [Leeuwenhoekiella sp.]MBA80885.1 hypothetical protein [Leeuwenhoekiella sp.]